MMSLDAIKATITLLRQEPERRETIQHYGGNRTLQELRTICGRKRNYYKTLEQIPDFFHDDLDRETWALILAMADYRKNRPHSAKVLAAVAKEREERKERHRYKKMTVEEKIRRDYSAIVAYRKLGMTWDDVRKELKKQSAYKKEKLHKDTLRHICKTIEKEI